VQGVGGGGINVLTQIIVSDLVPLHERGKFNGLVSMCVDFSTCVTPTPLNLFLRR
jgi:MFS family permease